MVRESKESLLGRHRRDEESATNGGQIGLLVVLAYLAAIVMAVALGSIPSGRDFDLLIALIMLVVAYAVLRDVNALNRLEAQNSSTGSSEPRPPQTHSAGGSSSRQARRMLRQQGEVRKVCGPVGWMRSRQQTMEKGMTHESNGFSKA